MFRPQHATPELPFHAWSLSVLSLPLWIEISWVLFILQYPVQTGSSPLLAESGHKAPTPLAPAFQGPLLLPPLSNDVVHQQVTTLTESKLLSTRCRGRECPSSKYFLVPGTWESIKPQG